MVLDTCLWISLRLHADTWLRGETRGCDGGIRKELAAGVRYGQTEANAPKFPTVTMVDSRTLTRADGITSLRLDTKEFGSIASRFQGIRRILR